MRSLLLKARWLLLGVLAAATVASVIAQEAQMLNRGLTINQGNLTTTRGSSVLTSGVFTYRAIRRDFTDAAVTYSVAEVRRGVIWRDEITSNRTDVLPTAANLVAEMPAAVVGSSFFFIVNNDDSAQTITVNGASTGVTYSGSCATALAADESMTILIIFTTITSGSEAYTAICQVN